MSDYELFSDCWIMTYGMLNYVLGYRCTFNMNTSDDDVQDLEDGVIICAVARVVETYYLKYVHKTPCMNSSQTGNIWLMEVLRGNDVRCYRMFRMNKDVFYRLCNDLQTNYGLKGSRKMNAIKILRMFLHMLGHGVKNRLAQERFQHSGEIVSRYFGVMLDIVCKMAIDIIKPMDSEFRGIPQEIRRDTRYMPYFKDCIGAINGVHVEASIPPPDQVHTLVGK
ncbi:uncharacterized protein LOC126595469 [Malus sylvestris]|uniref:uncharacterized protein LOC126595469 n=1 Tax=Malus sylvestris TaxID=3752 RepID=UPI0021AD4860|nr:uncharacterized protein LOC126595469 [Malus sylvestris]